VGEARPGRAGSPRHAILKADVYLNTWAVMAKVLPGPVPSLDERAHKFELKKTTD
jgi:hypothetical protein